MGFVAYLRGIETCLAVGSPFVPTRFVAYLRGIETRQIAPAAHNLPGL